MDYFSILPEKVEFVCAPTASPTGHNVNHFMCNNAPICISPGEGSHEPWMDKLHCVHQFSFISLSHISFEIGKGR